MPRTSGPRSRTGSFGRGSTSIHWIGKGFNRARDLYREVVELDPSSVQGWAGLAATEFVRGFFGHAPLDESMTRAEEFATKALELDPDSPGALTIRGSVELFWHWDWRRAKPSLLRAVELDPNNQIARHALADYYMVTGDQENSVWQVREGARRDPMSMMTLVPLVGHLSFAGLHDEAIAEAERAIELFPEAGFFGPTLARNLWWSGSYEEALRQYEVVWDQIQNTSRPSALASSRVVRPWPCGTQPST